MDVEIDAPSTGTVHYTGGAQGHVKRGEETWWKNVGAQERDLTIPLPTLLVKAELLFDKGSQEIVYLRWTSLTMHPCCSLGEGAPYKKLQDTVTLVEGHRRRDTAGSGQGRLAAKSIHHSSNNNPKVRIFNDEWNA